MMQTAIRLATGIALLALVGGQAAAEEIELFPEGTFDADPRAASKDDGSDAEEQARLSEMLCDRYGPDYTLVAGTTTCINATGHVRIDVYVDPGKRR
jgi:hypothetical protein